MLALNLGQLIAQRGTEVGIGGNDRAVQLELDHRLAGADRVQGCN